MEIIIICNYDLNNFRKKTLNLKKAGQTDMYKHTNINNTRVKTFKRSISTFNFKKSELQFFLLSFDENKIKTFKNILTNF